MEKVSTIRALSVKQPHAEAIIRGIKSIEFRSRPTNIRGTVYVYASKSRYLTEEEQQWMEYYGIGEVSCDDLPRGVVIGTVDVHGCDGGQWFVRNPVRSETLETPYNKPMPTWFYPFKETD